MVVEQTTEKNESVGAAKFPPAQEDIISEKGFVKLSPSRLTTSRMLCMSLVECFCDVAEHPNTRAITFCGVGWTCPANCCR